MMKNTDQLLRRLDDVVDVMRAAPAHRYFPYVLGGVLGVIGGASLAVYASVTTGLVVLGAIGALAGALWATGRACKTASRRYGG